MSTHTISVRLENEPGALARVSQLFSRRGYIIQSLAVGPTESADISRLTLRVDCSEHSLEQIEKHLQFTEPIRLESLLVLPGVVEERAAFHEVTDTEWQAVEKMLVAALDNLAAMRQDEGRAMTADLKANCGQIARELELVAQRAPAVVDSYRTRLLDRLNKMLAEHGVQVAAADVVREVGMFAERGDISEEIVRLRSHLEQFDTFMQMPESSGRKLEFLTQEMFRETNTIGSKANDAEIARHVIEIKAAIERIREMIQNVE